jgi:hypothetical protein
MTARPMSERDELAVIGRNITKFSKIVVMVDDIRCFDPKNPEYSTYPPVDFSLIGLENTILFGTLSTIYSLRKTTKISRNDESKVTKSRLAGKR